MGGNQHKRKRAEHLLVSRRPANCTHRPTGAAAIRLSCSDWEARRPF